MIKKEDFVKIEGGWELQRSALLFLGKKVGIYIDTDTYPAHGDQAIFDAQIETLQFIFSKWEELAMTIEREILEYEGITKVQLQEVLDSPHIWLTIDDNTGQPLQNQQWSFILGVTESEDFGWHVEFKGGKHQETWAGS